MKSLPTLTDLLGEHEKNLRQRIDSAKAELAALEAELADVEKARSVVSPKESSIKRLYRAYAPSALAARQTALAGALAADKQQEITIKQMVRHALKEKYPHGATATQLLEYFHETWGRDVMRTSLSPQLTRLKEAGEIGIRDNVWYLIPKAETPAEDQSAGASKTGGTGDPA